MSTPVSPPNSDLAMGSRVRNGLIALAAIALGIAVFLGLRTQVTATSLTTLAESATPLEVALTNNKPSLVEFYADWCTTCQAMAPELEELEQTYGDRINFVMLNVDNDKWLPEVLSYGVDGIPHFVFLAPDGEAIAMAIGEQPRPILAANLEALTTDQPLPHAQAMGRTSEFSGPTASQTRQDDPRAHGSFLVN